MDENIFELTTLQSIPKACNELLLVDARKAYEATIIVGAEMLRLTVLTYVYVAMTVLT